MKNTSNDLLSAPMLKIERAKYHINELNRNFDSYLAEIPFELFVRNDPNTTQRAYFIKTKKAIPVCFSLMIGDAIHNLRSALDILIFSMAGNKALKPKAIQFPFCDRAESLDSTINSRQIQFTGEHVVKAIRALKPYPGGDELLCGLHALNISDKHKIILTVGRVAQISIPVFKSLEPTVNISGDGSFRFTNMSGPIITVNIIFANRAERRSFKFSEKKTDIQPVFEICFGEGQAFASRPVNAELHAMALRVQDVINLLIAEYHKTP